MKVKKILYVTSEYPPIVGGISTHVDQLSKCMKKKGYDIQILSTGKNGFGLKALGNVLEIDRKLTVELFIFRKLPIFRIKPLYTIILRLILKKLVKAFNPDYVHVHGMRPLEATKRIGCPVFFTNHTSGFLKRIEKIATNIDKEKLLNRLSHLKGILAPSCERELAVLDLGYKGPTKFIPNGVDDSFFVTDGNCLRKKLGITNNQKVILLAGRLSEVKGVIDFANAMVKLSSISEVNKEFVVLIAGDGKLKGEMKKILARSFFKTNAIFLGYVPNHKMPLVYRSSDLIVLPSHYEATSITGLEAMSCGLPLVATNVGGLPYLVGDDIAGILVSPSDPSELALAINNLLLKDKKLTKLGCQARKRAVENFSWDKIAHRTESFIHKCLGEIS